MPPSLIDGPKQTRKEKAFPAAALCSSSLFSPSPSFLPWRRRLGRVGRGKGGSKTRRRLAREGGPRGERGFTAAAAAALLPFPEAEAEAEEALRAPASLFNSPLPSLPLPTSFGFRIKGGDGEDCVQYTKVFGALEIREKKRREGSGSLEGVFFYVALSAGIWL